MLYRGGFQTASKNFKSAFITASKNFKSAFISIASIDIDALQRRFSKTASIEKPIEAVLKTASRDHM
jgi:hypothetical protein